MTAKEYLNQAYRLNELIESNLRQLEALRARSTSLSSGGFEERVQATMSGDRIPLIVEKIIMLENKITAENIEMLDKLDEIRDTINKLEDRDERLALTLRYVEFKGWEEIAEKMHFEKRQVFRIHDRGLSKVEVICQ